MGDSIGANLAADAIAAALNQDPTVTTVGPDAGTPSDVYYIPFFQSSATIYEVAVGQYDLPTSINEWANTGSSILRKSYGLDTYATFTYVSSIPLPAAAWLFSSALFSLLASKKLRVT